MEQKPSEKVMKRIKKLLALSKSPNENEALAAFEQAHKLLREYHLEMSSVMDTVLDSNYSDIKESKTLEHIKFYKWERQLLSVVCKFNYTTYYFQSSGRGSDVFVVGRYDNIVATHEMFKWLRGYCINASKNQGSLRESYIMGMVDRLREKVEATLAAETQTDSRELVVMKNEAQSWLESKYKLTRITTKMAISDSAYQIGYAKAGEINLCKQVEGA